MQLTSRYIDQSNKKFLIKVKDTFLCNDLINQFKKILPDFQYAWCNNIEHFSEVCSNDSLFVSGGRIVVLSEVTEEALDSLVEIVEKLSDDVLLLLETSTISKVKSYTKLKSLCTYIDLREPSDSEKSVWVKKWMVEAGLKFPDEIPGYIVSRTSSNLQKLKNDIKKIIILLSEATEKIVTQELCDDVISSNEGSNFFVFMESFFRKKVLVVLNEFKKVDEYSYSRLLHFIVSQIERQYKIAVYKEQGLGVDQIAEIVGVPVFIVKTKLFTALSFYGKMKLMGLMDLFNKLDIELRTTKFPKNIVFEAYLLKALKT